MKFKELIEKTIGIQVINPDDSIKDLKKRVKVKATASKDYDDEILVNAKDKEKVVKWMIDFGGWEEDEISDLYPELFESTEEVNINLEKLVENCAARLPLGLQKAIFSNNGHKKLHKECDKCGFLMPKYAGRYPNYCAMCGDPVDDKDKEVVAEAKSIDPNKDDILFDVAEEVYSKLDYKDLQNGTKVKSMLKKLGYGTDAITVTRVMNKIKENM